MRASKSNYWIGCIFIVWAVLLIVGNSLAAPPNKTAEIPVADAGPDQTVQVGDTVVLDGTDSTDITSGRYRFAWEFVSRPAGSTAALSDPTAAKPSFAVDQSGV